VNNLGGLIIRYVKMTMDDSYPALGYVIDNSKLGLGSNAAVKGIIILTPNLDGYSLHYTLSSGRLRVYEGAAGAGPGTELATASAAMDGRVVHGLAFAITGLKFDDAHIAVLPSG
jgi:hypothetical protein